MQEELIDLGDRWRRARDAALRSVLSAGTTPSGLLAAALKSAPDEAHRRVFDNSLQLGQGFARTFKVELTLEQLRDALGSLGVPCLHGTVSECEGEEAFYLERGGCANAALGPAACDFFREAISGLVLGITGGIRHARHESVGRGHARCLDLLHVDPESPLRFGAIPEELHSALERARRIARAFDSTIEVTFLGLSEGVLIYRIDRRGSQSNVSVTALVERTVRREHPALALMEISPRSVFEE